MAAVSHRRGDWQGLRPPGRRRARIAALNTDDPPRPAAAPWLTVVMPTYNGARYLPAALSSIARERVEGMEASPSTMDRLMPPSRSSAPQRRRWRFKY